MSKALRKVMRNFIVIIFIILLIGCASTRQTVFNVSVDSLASSIPVTKKSYLLIPGNKGVSHNDLQFQEYQNYLKRLLNAKGYIAANSSDDADLAIVLSYGIGDPQTHQYSYSLPTWGQTGISSANTYGKATTHGNTTTVNATTTYTPTYGVTGSTTHTKTRTTFFRYLIITGYDYTEFKKSKKEIQIWKTTIGSIGSSGDLRRVFPVLMAASDPYLATNTGQMIQVSLYESANIVKMIKGLAIE